MKQSTSTLTLTLFLTTAGGLVYASEAQSGAWQSASDDTVTCMAIGCEDGDYQRHPEHASRYGFHID